MGAAPGLGVWDPPSGEAGARGGNVLRRKRTRLGRGSGRLDALPPTLPFAPSLRSAATTHLEEADAHVAGGRGEVLVIVKVNIAQAPGMCKLLPDSIEHPRAAQVPAWPGEGGQVNEECPPHRRPAWRDPGAQTPVGPQAPGACRPAWTNSSP